MAVQMLDESQDWYHDYLIEQTLKQQNEDDDYWGSDDDEDGPKQESHVKKQYDEMFALLRTALGNIKALSADTDDWVKLGPQRRLGKNVWHNYRTFERSMRLHHALVRILDIAHLDVFTSHYSKEPNYGVARKIQHPAVRQFWIERIAPRVLASHTGMALRAPPGLHPKKVEQHLACVDCVTQAPLVTVVTELIKFLKLDSREKMVLPYVLGGGCCDYEYGGVYTMGINPVCHPEAFEDAKKKWEAQAELVRARAALVGRARAG
jgi:hypothetical protein